MAGFPIRYVAREVRDNGKVVAYFVSKAHLFEERKIYKSDGDFEQKYEIDFVTQIYDEEYEVENSPAMKRYYKNTTFTTFGTCATHVNLLNYELWQKLIVGLGTEEVKQKKKEYKKYFEFANKMKCKCLTIELDR